MFDLVTTPDLALLRINPAGFRDGIPPTAGDVLAFLAERGVTSGIAVPVLEAALAAGAFEKPIAVATSTPAVPGEDLTLRFLISPEVKNAPLASGDGKVDFREIQSMVLVKAGDKLAVLEGPTAGVPGKDIFGKPIPADPGKVVHIQNGPNTRYAEDGVSLYAERAGYLYRAGDSPAVGTKYVLEGAVDFHTGNLNFPGDIHIKRGIGEGFTVNAGGSVVVEGEVDCATVISGGDITIESGCFGRGKGRLQAKGNIRVAFAQQCVLECNQLIVTKFLQDCKAIVSGLDASAKGCYVKGGDIFCYGAMTVYAVGSEGGQTAIHILDEQEELFRTEKAKLAMQVAKEKPSFDQMEKKLATMKAILAKAGPNQITPKVAAEMKALVEAYQLQRRKMANLQSEMAMIDESLNLPRERKFSLKILGSVTGTLGLEMFHIRRLVTQADSGKELMVIPGEGLVAR